MIVKNGVTVIDLVVDSIELECFACPTIYKFYDTDNQEYMLRERYNTIYLFTVANGELDELIISGKYDESKDYYGIANIDGMYSWLLDNNIVLNKYYKNINILD